MEQNPYQTPNEVGQVPARHRLPALSTGTWFAVAVAWFFVLTVALELLAGAMRLLAS